METNKKDNNVSVQQCCPRKENSKTIILETITYTSLIQLQICPIKVKRWIQGCQKQVEICFFFQSFLQFINRGGFGQQQSLAVVVAVFQEVSGLGSWYMPCRVTGMIVSTSALASSVNVAASSSNRKPGLSAPGFTTILSSTPATQAHTGQHVLDPFRPFESLSFSVMQKYTATKNSQIQFADRQVLRPERHCCLSHLCQCPSASCRVLAGSCPVLVFLPFAHQGLMVSKGDVSVLLVKHVLFF